MESIDKMRLVERIRKLKLCGLSPFFIVEPFRNSHKIRLSKHRFELIIATCALLTLGILSCGSVDKPSEKDVPKNKNMSSPEKKAEEKKKSEDKKKLKEEYPRKTEREKMVKTQIESEGIKDEKVLEAMRYVPRHLFVPEICQSMAYDDCPLPIGYGQTISQPYVVALMTENLELDSDSKVLEIGTGSGYQAAILAEICKDVYTIEIIKELYERATSTLESLEYENIATKHADGYFGWEEVAPFDAIIVTAASDHIPPPLIKQLKKGGRMCIPLGAPHQIQRLVLVTKNEKGQVTTKDITIVAFVPLTRQLEK